MGQPGHDPAVSYNAAAAYGGLDHMLPVEDFRGDPRRVLGHPDNPATAMTAAYLDMLDERGDPRVEPYTEQDPIAEATGVQKAGERAGQWMYASEFVHGRFQGIPENARLPEDHPVRAHLTALGMDGEPVASLAMGHEEAPEWFAVVDITGVPQYHHAGHSAYLAPFARPAVVQNDSPETFPLPTGDEPTLVVVHFEPNGKVATRLLQPGQQMAFGRGNETLGLDPESARFHYGDSSTISRVHGRMRRANGALQFIDDGSTFGSEVEFAYYQGAEPSAAQVERGASHQPDEAAGSREGSRAQPEDLRLPETSRIPGTFRLDAAGVEQINEVLHEGLRPNEVLLGATPAESLHAMEAADAMLGVLNDVIRYDHGALLALQGRGGALQKMIDTAGRMHTHWTGQYPRKFDEVATATDKSALQHAYDQLRLIRETVRDTRWDGTYRGSFSADGSTAANRAYIAFDAAEGLRAIAEQRGSVTMREEMADRLVTQFPKRQPRHAQKD